MVETTKDGGFSGTFTADVYDECATIWSGTKHCSRDANHAAHELAKRAMVEKQNCIWDDEPLSFILGFAINYLTVLNK